MAGQQPADDGGFPPGPKRHAALAGGGDLADHFGPLHQQVVHRIIDAVEFRAECREAAGRVVCGRGAGLGSGAGHADFDPGDDPGATIPAIAGFVSQNVGQNR